MNKEQLLQKADELIAKANELKELAAKENILPVPSNIIISMWSIHNWNHRLYYASWFWDWVVWNNNWCENIKCKLIPCKYEDLKQWDIFYRDSSNTPTFDDLVWYALKLKEWYRYWSKKNLEYSDSIFKYNWKVVPNDIILSSDITDDIKKELIKELWELGNSSQEAILEILNYKE